MLSRIVNAKHTGCLQIPAALHNYNVPNHGDLLPSRLQYIMCQYIQQHQMCLNVHVRVSTQISQVQYTLTLSTACVCYGSKLEDTQL